MVFVGTTVWLMPRGNMFGRVLLAVIGTLLLMAQADADERPRDRLDAQRYIIESEKLWAESTGHTATVTVERIIADDFVGVGPTGHRYDKADILAEIRKNPNDFVAAHLDEVKVRFYDNAAVAQGSESWVHRNGVRGRFVWTDTWIRRRGAWQIVAAQDVIPPSKPRLRRHAASNRIVKVGSRRLLSCRRSTKPLATRAQRIGRTGRKNAAVDALIVAVSVAAGARDMLTGDHEDITDLAAGDLAIIPL